MIVYLAADLIWATRIKATGDQLGIECRPTRNVDMLEARLSECDVTAALLDLEAEAVWDVLNRLRDPAADPSGMDTAVVCFGPHVAVDAFERARQSGAAKVLARGAFDRMLPDLLTKLAARG